MNFRLYCRNTLILCCLFMPKSLIRSSGFTLIELLVVIAIIGILSSVVLASLNTARGKGADAAVKANLNIMRTQAELFYDNPNLGNSSYAAVCADTSMGNSKTAAISAGGNGGNCLQSSSNWVAWAGLKTDLTLAWCVDSIGNSKQITKVQGSALTNGNTCPP